MRIIGTRKAIISERELRIAYANNNKIMWFHRVMLKFQKSWEYLCPKVGEKIEAKFLGDKLFITKVSAL